MLPNLASALVYGIAILSLAGIDHFLGHGFVDVSQRMFCKIFCSLRRTILDEMKRIPNVSDMASSVLVLIFEILLLGLTMSFLKRYKQLRRKDNIDVLLDQSKDTLRLTNEFLDKWHKDHVSSKYSYLEDEPHEAKPLKVEVPILHMAIIDTLGTTRSKPERGDAGDTVNIIDSTVFSMTSLFEDELETDNDGIFQESIDERNDLKFKNRCLWNVTEEDSDCLGIH